MLYAEITNNGVYISIGALTLGLVVFLSIMYIQMRLKKEEPYAPPPERRQYVKSYIPPKRLMSPEQRNVFNKLMASGEITEHEAYSAVEAAFDPNFSWPATWTIPSGSTEECEIPLYDYEKEDG